MQSEKLQRLVQEAARQLQAGRFDEAARLCTTARTAAPGEFAPLYVSGLVALQQGLAVAASDWLAKARRVQPGSASTVMSLGLAWNALGRQADAEKAMREAVVLSPSSAECWLNLAAVLVTRNRVDEGIAGFRKATELSPGNASAWNGLGSALLLAGRGHEAIAAHDRAIQLEPAHPKAYFSRAQALHSCHRTADALADFQTHLARQPRHLEARSYLLFLLNYIEGSSPQLLADEHRAYGRAVAAAAAARPLIRLKNVPVPERRLRVAFLSPDLRQHSIVYFLEPLLQHLDPAQFDVWLYHDHYCVDAVTRRLEKLAAGWRNFVGLSANAVEALIRVDAPDVLVDLAGHTGLNRLPLFARRLAPVQITYLGYPNTTGLEAMDFRFTDAVADPADADGLHTECLVRFAPTAWAYSPPEDAPEVAALPCRAAAAAPFTFGSFNVLSKASDTTLRWWQQMLAAVPDSRLVLKSGGLERSIWEARLKKTGFDLERVTLLPRCSTVAEHLAMYGRIDVALDPFPYQGTTTTCEALWMGRPVVTLFGNRHANRVGASLLSAIGRPDWIADSPADYVRIAASLAADRDALGRESRELRERMRNSVLLDHAGQAARFSAAVRETWVRWCADAAVPLQAAG